MKIFTTIVLQLFLFVFVVSFVDCVSSEKEPKRSKISSYALTPSLRIGRRSKAPLDILVHQRFMPLRIGRFQHNSYNDDDNNIIDDERYVKTPVKRTGSTNSGMWFGPRLGRVQKRGIHTTTDDLPPQQPLTFLIINDDGTNDGLLNRQVHYTPRLGRESEELLIDDSDNTMA